MGLGGLYRSISFLCLSYTYNIFRHAITWISCTQDIYFCLLNASDDRVGKFRSKHNLEFYLVFAKNSNICIRSDTEFVAMNSANSNHIL
jgi:hypothetical protein